MKICVVLPFPSDKPVGGFKIIYHYCDLLISKRPSIAIDILYGAVLPDKQNSFIKKILKKIYYALFPKRFYKWFNFENSHNIYHEVGIDIATLQNSDIIFATSITTATIIKKLNLNQPVFYFIQDFETWLVEEKGLYSSYHYGFKNIVVSKYLKNILVEDNAIVNLHLPNPIDDAFQIEEPVADRNVKSIIFMYHEDKRKGSKKILEAIEILSLKHDDIKISCFSVYDQPDSFPKGIDYYQKPSRSELNKLMNKHFLFINASYKEGYGLTPAEAMGSGCCVLTTDCGGVDDFAMDNETAYFVTSPPNVSEIVDKVEYIFTHKNDAVEIALNGSKQIRKFTWDHNVTKLLDMIDEIYEK